MRAPRSLRATPRLDPNVQSASGAPCGWNRNSARMNGRSASCQRRAAARLSNPNVLRETGTALARVCPCGSGTFTVTKRGAPCLPDGDGLGAGDAPGEVYVVAADAGVVVGHGDGGRIVASEREGLVRQRPAQVREHRPAAGPVEVALFAVAVVDERSQQRRHVAGAHRPLRQRLVVAHRGGWIAGRAGGGAVGRAGRRHVGRRPGRGRQGARQPERGESGKPGERGHSRRL